MEWGHAKRGKFLVKFFSKNMRLVRRDVYKRQILALLVTQVVAMPFSILFGRLAGKVGSINLLCGAVGIYFVITVVGFFMGFNIEQNPGDPAEMCIRDRR